MIKQSIIAICLIATATMAADIDMKDIAKNQGLGAGAENLVNTNRAESLSNIQRQNQKQNYYMEALYNHLKLHEEADSKGVVRNGNAVVANFDFKAADAEQKAIEAAATLAQIEEQTKPKIVFVSGYCRVPNKVSINRIAGYVALNCDFDTEAFKNTVLYTAITPDFYSYSLLGTPLYMQTKNKRYSVIGGVALNGLRNSVNLATKVDNYLVSKIIAETGVASSSEIMRYAEEYLNESINYRQQRGAQTVITTQTSTVTTQGADQYQKPKVRDYVALGILDIVTNLVNAAGNAYLSTRSTSFEIEKETIVFVDFKIDLNEQSMRGINYIPNNLIRQEATTDYINSADPTQGMEYPDVGFGDLPDNTGVKDNRVNATPQPSQGNMRNKDMRLDNTIHRNNNQSNGIMRNW